MIVSTLRHAAAALAFSAATLPAFAQEATPEGDRLLDLLRLPETIGIMRDEGIAYAATLVDDMVNRPVGSSWNIAVERIYDADRMEATVRDAFADAYEAERGDAGAVEAFLASETGRNIISLEVSARRAMSDEAIEEAARADYREAREEGADRAGRLAILDVMVTTNELIDANVVGGMNSSVRFYQGLADGDAIQLGEADILAQVWGSEQETRADTTEWLYGYLLMAYGPVSNEDLRRYVDLLGSPAGKSLNRALFAGFDQLFNDVSYDLGRALAREMQSEDL